MDEQRCPHCNSLVRGKVAQCSCGAWLDAAVERRVRGRLAGSRILLAGFVAWLLLLPCTPFLLAADQRLRDLGSRFHPEPPPRVPLVGVFIDDRSLQELGISWPIPRSLYLEVVERLERAGARTIAIDILFVTPGDPAQDARLALAVSRPSVVLPCPSGGREPFVAETWSDRDRERRLGLDIALGDDVREALLALPTARPAFAFEVAAVADFQGRSPGELARAVGRAESLRGLPSLAPVPEPPEGVVVHKEPEPESVEALVTGRRWFSSPTPPKTLSLHRLLSMTEAELRGFAGQPFLALVGAKAQGTYDERLTPLGRLSGVEIQGHLIAQLMLERRLHPAPRPVFLGALLLAALLGAAAGGRAFGWGSVSFLSAGCVLSSLVWRSFGPSGQPPLMGAILALWAGWGCARYVIRRRRADLVEQRGSGNR